MSTIDRDSGAGAYSKAGWVGPGGVLAVLVLLVMSGQSTVT
jgi:hypothetical protein